MQSADGAQNSGSYKNKRGKLAFHANKIRSLESPSAKTWLTTKISKNRGINFKVTQSNIYINSPRFPLFPLQALHEFFPDKGTYTKQH